MERKEFREFCKNNIVILDGASGTLMQSRGMPSGICPDIFAMENPILLADIQREYYEAGSNIVYAFTFGANLPKLSHYGIGEDKVYETNKSLAEISCSVRDEFRSKNPDKTFLVAGDMAPTGRFLQPSGDMEVKELKSIYTEQARGLADGGVDLFVIETMMDLAEARIAVIAIREISDLPIMVTLTFDKGKTLMGNRPLECLITLESLGIDAFGANCSTGPEEMTELLAGISKMTNLPIIAKPNAGMPEIIDGVTVFPMQPEEFGEFAKDFYSEGVTILGGCCGTTPEHISELTSCADGIAAALTGKNKNINTRNDLLQAEETIKAEELPSDERLVNAEEFTNAYETAKTVNNMIASSRESISITPETKFEFVKCTDPDDLPDEFVDACDNEPDCVVIDFTLYENSAGFNLDKVMENFQMVTMMNHIPIAIKSGSAIITSAIAETYCGRLALFCDENTSNTVNETIKKYGIYRV
jgi:methionine synthase I (cobalamin-dependent)